MFDTANLLIYKIYLWKSTNQDMINCYENQGFTIYKTFVKHLHTFKKISISTISVLWRIQMCRTQLVHKIPESVWINAYCKSQTGEFIQTTLFFYCMWICNILIFSSVSFKLHRWVNVSTGFSFWSSDNFTCYCFFSPQTPFSTLLFIMDVCIYCSTNVYSQNRHVFFSDLTTHRLPPLTKVNTWLLQT